jgi:hypothetical protein
MITAREKLLLYMDSEHLRHVNDLIDRIEQEAMQHSKAEKQKLLKIVEAALEWKNAPFARHVEARQHLIALLNKWEGEK